MLKYINENLQVGDHITIETKKNLIFGDIAAMDTVSLCLSCKDKTVRLSEDDITTLVYYEDNIPWHFPFYLTKVYPFEMHPDSFYGYDYHHRLGFSYFDGVLSVYATEKTHELGPGLLLPDWVEYDGKLYVVEAVINESYHFPSTIGTAKMPFFVKEIDPGTFENCCNLRAIYLPPPDCPISWQLQGGRLHLLRAARYARSTTQLGTGEGLVLIILCHALAYSSAIFAASKQTTMIYLESFKFLVFK